MQTIPLETVYDRVEDVWKEENDMTSYTVSFDILSIPMTLHITDDVDGRQDIATKVLAGHGQDPDTLDRIAMDEWNLEMRRGRRVKLGIKPVFDAIKRGVPEGYTKTPHNYQTFQDAYSDLESWFFDDPYETEGVLPGENRDWSPVIVLDVMGVKYAVKYTTSESASRDTVLVQGPNGRGLVRDQYNFPSNQRDFRAMVTDLLTDAHQLYLLSEPSLGLDDGKYGEDIDHSEVDLYNANG